VCGERRRRERGVSSYKVTPQCAWADSSRIHLGWTIKGDAETYIRLFIDFYPTEHVLHQSSPVFASQSLTAGIMRSTFSGSTPFCTLYLIGAVCVCVSVCLSVCVCVVSCENNKLFKMEPNYLVS